LPQLDPPSHDGKPNQRGTLSIYTLIIGHHQGGWPTTIFSFLR